MDAALRASAAHVLVSDVDVPEPPDAAVHHLRRVLRLRDGEPVTVTDGAGRWRACVVAGSRLEPSGAVVAVDKPLPPLTIAVAPPKGDRLDWLVAKCTEIGIDRIVLLEAERSVVRWAPDRAAHQLARLRRIIVEASGQSRRAWFPEIVGPVPAAQVLPQGVAAEPGGDPLSPRVATVAIGPEGGWTTLEIESAGGTISLGEQILRVETAAVAAAVLMVSQR